MRSTPRFSRAERGAVLIWYVLFLLITLCFVSLGIDIAKLATTRTQLQNAADAAALAGASAIDFEAGTLSQSLAIARAQQTAAMNQAFIDTPRPVALEASDVVFPTPTRVRVTVRREGGNAMVTTFAQVLGIRRLEMTATATAEADTAKAVDCGLVPLGVTPNPDQDFVTGCSPGYTLKFGAGAGSQGNYGALDLPECDGGPCAGRPETGASTFECLVRNGYCCPIEIGQQLPTEPGNMAGPFRKAIEDRFEADSDRREGICYDDYKGTGQRIINVLITTDAGPGRTSVTVLGFSSFFISNKPGSGNDNGLIGQFLHRIVPGDGGGSSIGPVAYTLRLVQ